MWGMADNAQVEGTPTGSESVINRILGSFVDAVAEQEGLQEVASRLRETILEKKQLSEEALRDALFGKTP
jgi:hypothetical protein